MFGKLYYIISEILPCVNHNIILGYSLEDFDRIQENEAFIYSYFIQNELLFNQKEEVKKNILMRGQRLLRYPHKFLEELEGGLVIKL